AKADPMELDHRASPGNWASMAVAWNIGRGTGRPISAASGGGAAALGPALAAERSFLALLRTLGARAFRLAGEGPVAAGAARMRLRRRMARPAGLALGARGLLRRHRVRLVEEARRDRQLHADDALDLSQLGGLVRGAERDGDAIRPIAPGAADAVDIAFRL